jgi:AraC-like DNA-binding protein
MESGITLYSIILILGAAHGLFLALALLNARGGNLIAHRLLALLTLVFAFDLGQEYLWQIHYYSQATFLVGITIPITLLYAPLVYLYVKAMTSPAQFSLKGKRWLHSLPFLAGYLLMIPFFTLDGDLKLMLLSQMRLNQDIEADSLKQVLAILGLTVIVIISIIQIGIYLWLAVRQLFRHARNIRNQFSYTERISLSWARNLLIGMSGLYVVYFIDNFLSESLGFGEEFGDLLMVMIVVLIYTMGYLGLRQPAIFSRLEVDAGKTWPQEEIEAQHREPVSWNSEHEKYKKSALDEDMSKALLVELESEMNINKPYLDGGLTLPQLAGRLGISTNYLSQIINEQLGQNFFDFINRYRIEEAKRHLADTNKGRINILTLALDAGFNSKSAFYTAFKKHTDMTPGQFKKSASKR